MKALILAAGLGTRLRPLTDKTPKPLLMIGGKPLLTYHLESLAQAGCTEALINSHYLAEQINNFVANYSGPIKITVSYEQELLGSAGTLSANRDFFANQEDFLVVYGDNLTNIDYNKLWCYHKAQATIATLACYLESNPAEKGVVTYDLNNRLLSFIEKPGPGTPASYVNGGIYVFSQRIFDYLSKDYSESYDISRHLFSSQLITEEQIYIYKMTEFLLDIGNQENYLKANQLCQTIFN